MNSLVHLILCGDGFHICKSCHNKIKENKAPCHAVTEKLLAEWSQKELWKLNKDNLSDQRLERCRRNVSHMTKSCTSKILNLKQIVDSDFCRSCKKTISST